MCEALALSGWRQTAQETYLDFYSRILKHQMDNLLKAGTRVGGGLLPADDAMTWSHQMLVCVIWLEKIDCRLPGLIQVKFAREFQDGASLIDLVPVLAESIDELMSGLEGAHHGKLQETCAPVYEDVKVKHEVKPNVKKETVDNGNNEDADDNEFDYSFDQPEIETEYIRLEGGSDGAAQPQNNPNILDLIKLEMPPEDQDVVPMLMGQPLPTDDLPLFDMEDTGDLKKKIKLTKKKKKLGRKSKPKKEKILQKKQLLPLNHDIICDKCDYVTRYVKEFRVHQKDVHNNSVRYCKKCDKFVELASFKRHLATAHRSQPSVCPECAKPFRTDQGLLGHRLKVHNIGEGYMCEFCPYKTVKMSHLQNHMKNHSDCPKPYVCNECGVGFARKDSLQNHVKYRHEGVIYYCDQCDFSTPRGLKSFKLHMNKEHLGLIFAKCDKCGQKFKSRYQLRTHMATIHGSGKYYSCSKCDYNATTKQLLQEHDMKVHELIFFRCEICPSKFVRKYALRRHMENVHKLFGVKVE